MDNALIILARYSTIYIPKNQAKPIIMEMIAGYNDAIKTSLDDLKLDEITKRQMSKILYKNSILLTISLSRIKKKFMGTLMR